MVAVRRRQPTLKYRDEHLVRAWQAASILMDYPDDTTVARLGLLADAAGSVPDSLGRELHKTIDHLATRDLRASQSDYVETFDTRKRGCLFLTYFSHGDTRNRGLALLRIKQVYTKAGLVLTEEQLPDHLCVVLEFAATTDLRAGTKMILDNRAGLELLRLHLRDVDSPWSGALNAVCTALPPLKGKDYEAVQNLIAEGPAEEMVGLEPYGGESAAPPAGC